MVDTVFLFYFVFFLFRTPESRGCAEGDRRGSMEAERETSRHRQSDRLGALGGPPPRQLRQPQRAHKRVAPFFVPPVYIYFFFRSFISSLAPSDQEVDEKGRPLANGGRRLVAVGIWPCKTPGSSGCERRFMSSGPPTRSLVVFTESIVICSGAWIVLRLDIYFFKKCYRVKKKYPLS